MLDSNVVGLLAVVVVPLKIVCFGNAGFDTFFLQHLTLLTQVVTQRILTTAT